MFSKLFSPLPLFLLAFLRPTSAELSEAESQIAFEDLQRVDSVPQNIAMLFMVINSSQIFEVAPPISSLDDATKNVSEDYVILPQINSDGNGSTPHFPYFVRITLLRMGQDGTNTVSNADLELNSPTRSKAVEERNKNEDHDDIQGGVILSGHLIHVLTVLLYVFFGLGLILFVLHNFITCISIAIWGKDHQTVEQLPTTVRSSFRRRASYGTNSYFTDKHPFYEPL